MSNRLSHRLWGLLFEPSSRVVEREGRERARLVAVVVFWVFLACLTGAVTNFFTGSLIASAMFFASFCVGVAYGLSRTRFYTVAGVIVMIVVTIPSVSILLRGSGASVASATNALIWIALPMVISCLLFSLRGTIIANSLMAVGAVAASISSPVLVGPDGAMPSSFLVLVAILSTAVGHVVQRNREAHRLMLVDRDRAESALRQAKGHLESRVHERTAELQRSNEVLGAVIESSPAAVVIIDDKGLLSTWNPAAERILGWISQEVIGQPLPFKIMGPETPLPAAEWPAEGLPDSVLLDLEVRVTNKTGDALDASLSTAPLIDPLGTRVGVLGLIVDISERKQLEAQLFQSQKMEAIGRLAGGVAHDFNNMMTVINGCSEIALSDTSLAEDTREDLTQIQSAGKRAAELTQRLLAFSRRQVLQPRPVDLNEIIEQMGGLLRRVLSEDIDLDLDLTTGLSAVMADRSQIEQVILNLAVNARDAMPAGGTLSIRTRHHEQAKQVVRLVVEDTGEGMTPDIKERIFEPFFSTKDVGKGTGLGLSMIYGVIIQSGGAVDVDSVPGVGTTFEITLPLVQAECPAPGVASHPVLSRGTETILVVEDEGSVRALVQRVLERLGYRILEASSASEAIDRFHDEKGPIHLVLTDVVMPEMGGIECVRELRGLRSDFAVLYMSGHADDELRRHGELDGELIHKPFTAQALARHVRDALEDSGHSTLHQSAERHIAAR